jgi:hypothetical protein
VRASTHPTFFFNSRTPSQQLLYPKNPPCLSSLDPSDPNTYPCAAMNLHKIRLLTIFALLVGLASLLIAQEPPAATGQQLLILRNGQALEGRINRSGDVYRVALADGEIRIKAADVEFICRDFEEGYQRKRAAIPIDSLRDRLDLAQWCQQHRLYDHAAAELADAAAIAPENPMVGFLQRRLQASTEPSPDPPKAETSRDISLSNEELDRMIRGLPHKAIENFTQSVQPLLMNNCTAAGCHGPQSASGLRLQRIPLDLPAGRRLTQRNIYAVLQYVDRDNPLASRILTVPTTTHGTAKTAVFTEHQAIQYKRLVDWVLQLGPSDMPEAPMAFPNTEPMMAENFFDTQSPTTEPHILPKDARKARPMPPVSRSSAGAAAGSSSNAVGATTNIRPAPGSAKFDKSTTSPKYEVNQAAFQAPISNPTNADPSADPESQRPKIKRGATPPESAPKDAFDPEIFNRRYFKQKSPDSSSSSSTSSSGN